MTKFNALERHLPRLVTCSPAAGADVLRGRDAPGWRDSCRTAPLANLPPPSEPYMYLFR